VFKNASGESEFGITAGYVLDHQEQADQVSVGSKFSSYLHGVQADTAYSRASYSMTSSSPVPGVKLSGREDDCSHPSSAEVNNL
jgi:hypothetical protein